MFKSNLDELKKLLAKKTLPQIIAEIKETKEKIETLEKKKAKLTNVDAQKVDEAEVDKIEK